MVERPGSAGEGSPAYLLASALHLQQAAVRAGRLDVAAKADEILALLGSADNPVQPEERGEVGEAIQRILNGLGF